MAKYKIIDIYEADCWYRDRKEIIGTIVESSNFKKWDKDDLDPSTWHGDCDSPEGAGEKFVKGYHYFYSIDVEEIKDGN